LPGLVELPKTATQVLDFLRAWRDSNPQPSDPKFVLIHNQLPQQRGRVRFGGLLPFFLSAHYLLFYLIVETTMETNFTGCVARIVSRQAEGEESAKPHVIVRL
jgi:hypothetical protein